MGRRCHRVVVGGLGGHYVRSAPLPALPCASGNHTSAVRPAVRACRAGLVKLTRRPPVLRCLRCMSARKAVAPESFSPLTLQARQTRLSLSPDSVIIHKAGIEFRSLSPFSAWTEMTLTLRSPRDVASVHCSGVVISCTGNRHTGYHVSMVFTGVSKHAQATLSALASSRA